MRFPLALLVLTGGILAGTASLAGQEEVQGVVTGQLLVAGVPADSGTVVLHEVTPDVAHAIDSLQVGPDGSFSFVLPRLPIPGTGDAFFVSTVLGDMVYLGAIIETPAALDSLYLIEAYPSIVAPPEGVAFPLALREVWISEGPFGWRVTDLFYLENSSATTYLPAAGSGVVWSHPLPPEAQSVRLLDSGFAPGEVRGEEGTLYLNKAVVPGTNRVIVQYDLASLDFDIAVRGQVGTLRVIVEEPVPPMRVVGLAPMEPAEVEPGTFVTYWAGEDLSDQTISVRSGEEEQAVPPAVWMALTLALLLAVVGIWRVQKERVSAPAAPGALPGGTAGTQLPRGRPRAVVLLELAKLDESVGEGEEAARDYRTRRAELLRELNGR